MRCEWCGGEFHANAGPGRPARYCRRSHRQRAYEARQLAGERGISPDGQKHYAIWDVYPHADLIAYPSTYEGFGNAFLEAVYYRKPIFCNRYTIFRTDIEPYGFDCIVMDGYLTDDVVDRVRHVLTDEARRRTMVEHNYKQAERFFSFERVEQELALMLARR